MRASIEPPGQRARNRGTPDGGHRIRVGGGIQSEIDVHRAQQPHCLGIVRVEAGQRTREVRPEQARDVIEPTRQPLRIGMVARDDVVCDQPLDRQAR